VSVDFDLFSESAIDRALLQKVKRVFTNRPVQPSVNNPDELTAFVDNVKITFLTYPFPRLEPQVAALGQRNRGDEGVHDREAGDLQGLC
jgi:hypothetical protein